jgi:uncharacterized protein (TIGR04255 family)
MGEKWKNPPVFYTVAQLKFNPVAQIEKYVPEIQDRLRLRGFPDFRKESALHCLVDVASSEVKSETSSRWNFSNSDKTQGYLLYPDAIAYHATSYEDFEQFAQQVIAGLKDVHAVAKLAYLERTGLRYLDAITPDEGQHIEAFLATGFGGTTASIEGKLKHRQVESVFDTPNGVLISRVFMVDGGLPLPPDIHPLPLSLPKRFRGRRGINATLDNDCFALKRTPLHCPELDEDSILDQLRKLKNSLNEAFYSQITDYAKEVWN